MANEMFVWSAGNSPTFSKYRLIVPCVSVGNVGQLAVDLFINTWRLPRIGFLDHPAILPLVGNDAFDHTHPAGYLHTAAEVYEDERQKLVILQFRTPLMKHLVRDFCSKLLEWSNEVGISDVVVLTSSYAHERRDSQLVGEQFRFFLSPAASDIYTSLSENLCWKVLESRPLEEDAAAVAVEDVTTSNGHKTSPGIIPEQQLFLPGAGLAKSIYKESSLQGVRLLILLAFCIQGDNIPDAVAMANKVQNLIKNDDKTDASESWVLPSSWNLMYGGPSPSDLF